MSTDAKAGHDGSPSTVEQAKGLLARLMDTHAWKAYQRYGAARGNVLAGGIAYFAFFSVFPALAAALSILGFTMRGLPEFRSFIVDNLVSGVGAYLPGLIHPGSSETALPDQTGIFIDDYLTGTTLTIGLVVSLGTLLFTGLGWIDGMRQGIRAVFGEDAGGGNFAVVKLRDLGVMLVIGVGVLLSVVAVLASNAAGGYVLSWIGVEESTVGKALLLVAGFVVAFAIDTCTFLAVFRVLPGADLPFRDLLSGAVLGGVGIGLLKQFGTAIASRSAEGNAFLGAAASIVVLLVLMNLIGRLILLAAAWAATHAEDTGSLPAPTTYREPLGPGIPEVPETPRDRRQDRVTLVSGVVLGAAAAGVTAAVRRGVRAVRR